MIWREFLYLDIDREGRHANDDIHKPAEREPAHHKIDDPNTDIPMRFSAQFSSGLVRILSHAASSNAGGSG
jgi:hypothetical protein